MLAVSPLLRELIRAFGDLPAAYDEHGPGGRLAAVLLDQVAAAPALGLMLPLPQDARLREVCLGLEDARLRQLGCGQFQGYLLARPALNGLRQRLDAMDRMLAIGASRAARGAALASDVAPLERLRADARTELLPVVILTSSDEQKDRLKSYENGCNSFVQKPVDFAEFVETVARLGVYWLATNEPPPERPLRR